MPAYFTLFNWTEKGVHDVKDTAQRAKAARAAWEAAGGRFIGIWWTMGQYDGVVIHETPDEETANRLLMKIGMQGNIRTMTLRAFGEEDMERMLMSLG